MSEPIAVGMMPTPDVPAQWLKQATVFVRMGANVFTMPWEMGLRWRFGTRYFSPVAVVMTWLVMQIVTIISLVLGLVPGIGWSAAPVGMSTLLTLFDVAWIAHLVRLVPLAIHQERELISISEGPALPFFRMLPKGDSYVWVRVVMEPGLAFLLVLVLYTFGVLSGFAALYLLMGSVALFVKMGTLVWDSWEYVRILNDQKEIAKGISKLSRGEPISQPEVAFIIGTGATSDSPQARAAAAQWLGITPTENPVS